MPGQGPFGTQMNQPSMHQTQAVIYGQDHSN